jgi:hypothetical protein
MSNLMIKLMISVVQVALHCQIQSAQVLENRMFQKNKRAIVVVVHCLASRFIVCRPILDTSWKVSTWA